MSPGAAIENAVEIIDANLLKSKVYDELVSGGGCAEDTLSGNPCPNPAVAFFDNTREAGMMWGSFKAKFRNGGQRPRCAKMVRKNEFLTYVLDFSAVLLALYAVC